MLILPRDVSRHAQTISRPIIRILRELLVRPKLSVALPLIIFPPLTWLVLRLLHYSGWGRWYWNYEVALHPALAYIIPHGSWGPIGPPPRWVETIYAAPWAGSWDTPQISSSSSGPAILKLHIFSTVQPASRSKRALIRSVSPLLHLPERFRHLVEMRFVIGHSRDEAEANEIEREQATYGDLVQLELKNGENLREGKILDWMRAVGAGADGGREAWWVLKMDDDVRPGGGGAELTVQTVVNLPNLLDDLLALDPREPTYVGTSLNRWPAYHYHFTGMLTGYNWGVVSGRDRASR